MDKLKEYRKNLGYSIKDISSFLGISEYRYKRYENGIDIIPISFLTKLSDLYFINELDFYSKEEYNHNSIKRISRNNLKEISEFYSLVKSYSKISRLCSIV